MNSVQYKPRTRRLVEAAQSLYATAYNNNEPDVDSSPCPSLSLSDVSSIFYDSDKDPKYDPSASDESEIIESTSFSNSSTNSEHTTVVDLQNPVTFFTNDLLNDAHENVRNLVNEDLNGISNDTNLKYTDVLPVDDQVTVESVPNLLSCNETHEVLPVEFQNVPTVINKRWKKKKTFCQFCTLEVTNFERHLERNHKDCKKVAEMLLFPKKSKERKRIIGLLRNEGHFDEFLRGNVRPIYQTKNKLDGLYYPCVNCKGLYSQKFLSRHYNKCPAVTINKDSKRIKHLSASQTLIACALNSNNALHTLRVKKEVFDIMKADEISLVAKADVLICLFGEQYLKKHSRKQMAVVCSNKMRELARLLIEFRRIKNDENCTLLDMINPVMFDEVIECAKRLGGYDQDKKVYRAPSLSVHLGTSLKQASDLFIRLILKQDPAVKLKQDPEIKIKEVKRFRELISSQWTTEIGSLAYKNLNEAKWNKPTILPLTKDILKFKDYVVQVANKAVAALRENPINKQEFKKLVEATLILTILYNRRRIGDVQYTKLQTYLNNFLPLNQEECLNSLSESEKILTKYYKRIITGGKGTRAIVILFPQNLQDYMNFIINIRQTTDLVPPNNLYLFAYPNSEHWIRGDAAIRRFAQKANLDRPGDISSNKLRKQIATVMQILNLNQEETEQFAQFMGHTEKTHNEFYKLPQDIYQTAKISKLLILMDKGSGHKYKGKSLSEININPEVDLAELEDSEKEEESFTADLTASVDNCTPKSPELSISSATRCKQSGRTAWTKEQAEMVKNYFKRHIQVKKPPKKHECEELIKKHPHLFNNKDWVRVKTYVYNTYRNK